MVGKTAKLSMSSPSPPDEKVVVLAASGDARARTLSLPSSSSSPAPGRSDAASLQPSAGATRPTLAAQSQRLNTWRSDVHASSDGASVTAEPSTSPSPEQDPRETMERHPSDETARQGSPESLKEPRRLHDDTSPPLLSTYDEPIRRVVEDMREQRMSLCQSLRQYVFVHRAIIEGALRIVDEEKKHGPASASATDVALRAGGNAAKQQKRKSVEVQAPTSASAEKHAAPTFAPAPAPLPTRRTSFPASAAPGRPTAGGLSLGAPFTFDHRPRGVSRKRSAPDFDSDEMSGVDAPSTATSPSSRAKRGASPTELLKEGLDGGVLLTKRPSLKRRQRSGEHEGPFDPLVMSVSGSTPPPA